MRLFELGELTEPGLRLHRGNKDDSQVFVPLGSPKSGCYIPLRVGKSLHDGPNFVSEAHLQPQGRKGFVMTKQRKSDGKALVRVCIPTVNSIDVRYEVGHGALILMGGKFNCDPPNPPVPMYLIEMEKGSSFRWQRGLDGVVYTWDGENLIETRGTELPS